MKSYERKSEINATKLNHQLLLGSNEKKKKIQLYGINFSKNSLQSTVTLSDIVFSLKATETVNLFNI